MVIISHFSSILLARNLLYIIRFLMFYLVKLIILIRFYSCLTPTHVLTYNLTLQVIASQWLPFGHFLEYLSERALIGTGSTLLDDVFGEQSGDLFDHCCRDALINRYSFAIRDLLDVSMNQIG